jgi:hypothetical protein
MKQMTDKYDVESQICKTGLPESIEKYASPDIRPGKNDDGPQENGIAGTDSRLITACAFPEQEGNSVTATSEPLDATLGVAKRRANFAAPESGDGRKRGSGGLDSLGGGKLP